jgi:putative endonuclease
LVFCEYFTDPKQAIAFEKQVKGWSRAKKEALISGDWKKIAELAKCVNLSSSENFNNENQYKKKNEKL